MIEVLPVLESPKKTTLCWTGVAATFAIPPRFLRRIKPIGLKRQFVSSDAKVEM
jgi:hypothetical protein